MVTTDEQPIVDQWYSGLEDVTDPERPISIVDLGLVYDITYDDGHVDVDMTLTAMGYPEAQLMKEAMVEQFLKLKPVENGDVEIVWDPVWTKDKMTEKERQKLRSLGISV